MRDPLRHPRERTLYRFADGELATRRAERVARHVGDCLRCRTRLQFVRALREAARDAPPTPPAGILDAVLDRRAAGDRVILPAGDPATRRVPRTVGRAAAAIVVLTAGFVATQVGDAGAQASELRFEPPRPERGETVSVTYTPDAALRGQGLLHLRARMRDRHDESYNGGMTQAVAATLRPDGDGDFIGEFELPGDIVFASFAVETPAGDVVDTNGRRLWEILVHAPDGRPLPDALDQRSNDLMGRNWELAFESARELARLYPDEPGSLSKISFFEPLVMGEQAWRDSGLAVFRTRFVRLDAKLRDVDTLSGAQVANMMWAASRAEDSTARARWRARLVAEHPRHTQALQQQVLYDIVVPHYADTARVTTALDSVWRAVANEPERGGPGYGHLLSQGLGFAAGDGDAELTGVWADRYLDVWPTGRLSVARSIATVPALRSRAIALLEEELTSLESLRDEDRPLHLTTEENRRRVERPMQAVLAQLGNVLIDAGETERGSAVLARAAATGWDSGVFRRIADAQLELGHTAAALTTLARVAADPAASSAFSDSARVRLGAAFDPVVWEASLVAARKTMRDRTLEDATMRSLPDRVRLVTHDGHTRTLSDITGGRPAFVTMWDRYCGAAIEALPGIASLAAGLEARGVAVVVIAEQPPSEELDAFLDELGVELTMYHDTRKEASRAFNAWGTPEYFITDGDGMIRFEHTDLESVLRQIAALEESGEETATEGEVPAGAG